jgi:23S rRNA pseudouridine2605 synthase
MAKRPRSNKSDSKRTSFGKKTGAEKDFKKGRKSRSEDSDRAPRFSKSAGRSSRDDKGGSDFRAKRPSRFGGSDEKRSFDKPERKSFGAGKPGRPEGFTKRPSGGFSKSSRPERDGDAPKRSYRKSDDSSFSKPGRSSFSKPGASRGEDRPKRSFGKRDDDSSSRPERPKFSKPDSREGGEEKKSFRESPSFSRPDRAGRGDFKKVTKKTEGDSSSKPRYSKSEGGDDFKKTDKKFDSGSFSRPYKPTRFTKTRKDGDEEKPARKSFVESRKDASSKFGKRASTEEKVDDGLIRLNKYIANSGVGSRREADELIKMGLVSVNGTVITEMGHKIKPTDEVRYEDRLLKAEKLVYLLLNKPKGFITTTVDPQERNTVMNLVASACKERVYPVGRLDRNTTGLLLLTNDGDLADKLTHPSYQAKKIYKVELDKPLTKNDFEKIKAGVHLEEGKAIVDEIANVSDDSMTIGIEIHIGWNRVVRRIFESLDYQVVRLDRVVYAGLDKKDLPRGEWRFLKPEEIIRLKHFK